LTPFAFSPFFAGIAFYLSLLVAPVVAYSEKLQTQEYEVKAAFLFNFAKLTEWPGDAFRLPDKNFEMCILGDDPFRKSLDTLSHRTIGGRKVSITRITDISESSACNLIYVTSSVRDRLPEIIEHVRNKAILTVSDIKGFENEGGIIALFLKDNRVKFRVNIDAASKSNLKISSYLLEVAERVRESGR
jgi:hypothetical protein